MERQGFIHVVVWTSTIRMVCPKIISPVSSFCLCQGQFCPKPLWASGLCHLPSTWLWRWSQERNPFLQIEHQLLVQILFPQYRPWRGIFGMFENLYKDNLCVFTTYSKYAIENIPRICHSCSQKLLKWSPASPPWVRCLWHRRWCYSVLSPRESLFCSCVTCYQIPCLWVIAGLSRPTQWAPRVFKVRRIKFVLLRRHTAKTTNFYFLSQIKRGCRKKVSVSLFLPHNVWNNIVFTHCKCLLWLPFKSLILKGNIILKGISLNLINWIVFATWGQKKPTMLTFYQLIKLLRLTGGQ